MQDRPKNDRRSTAEIQAAYNNVFLGDAINMGLLPEDSTVEKLTPEVRQQMLGKGYNFRAIMDGFLGSDRQSSPGRETNIIHNEIDI